MEGKLKKNKKTLGYVGLKFLLLRLLQVYLKKREEFIGL